MRIAYIGDFINHGKSLQTIGTSIVILLSLLSNVDSIDVFCPEVNERVETFELPQKVKLYETYRYDDSISILRLLRIQWYNYDAVIFNMMPTGFGNRTLPNAYALIGTIVLRIIFRQSNIKVVYHNSVFTNDVRKLGYNTPFDRMRSFFLGIVERTLFKNVSTFVLLDLYKRRIDEAIGKNKVQVLNARYLEAVTTVYVNKIMNTELIEMEKKDPPMILMHGSWGPQKDIELGLSTLKKLKEEGINFRLIISGGLNQHFPEYERKFYRLLRFYSNVVDEYLGPVCEKNILEIFSNADLLLLPYNTPGGHSGVLEQAIFFNVPTIAIDFPEYKEQANGTSNVKFALIENLYSTIINCLQSSALIKKVSVRDKIRFCRSNVQHLLEIDINKR